MTFNLVAEGLITDAPLTKAKPDRVVLSPNPDEKDAEGLALLKRIFPEDSIENLRKTHAVNLQRLYEKRRRDNEQLEQLSYKSHLCSAGVTKDKKISHQVQLPNDFLRLPTHTAVQRFHSQSQIFEYHLVDHFHRRVLLRHQQNNSGIKPPRNFYTRVLAKHPETGIGITLTESMGMVRVYGVAGLVDRKLDGPAIEIGDIVVGINGITLMEIVSYQKSQQSLIRQIVAILKKSPSPVVLHLQKANRLSLLPTTSTASLLDETLDESFLSEPSFELNRPPCLSTALHPLSLVLESRGLVKTLTEQADISKTLHQFAERSDQWRVANSFRIDSESYHLLPLLAVAAHQASAFETPACKSEQSNALALPTYICAHPAAATSTESSIGDEASLANDPYSRTPLRQRYPSLQARAPIQSQQSTHILIPLIGVRKALSVRILNNFLDGNNVAYTIWVCDIESSREWYAPLRYHSDFEDLRAATMNLRSDISNVAFPTQGWFSFMSTEASESDKEREMKCRQLENFLRSLCSMVYTQKLHPAVAEVAIHLQSFLGCDRVFQCDAIDTRSQALSHVNFMCDGLQHNEEQLQARTILKRSLQLYTFRVFLLEPMVKIVAHFVDTARASGPTLHDIEMLQAKSCNALKKRASADLKKIQAVVDQLQDLILEGCAEDLRQIARSEASACLHSFISGENRDSYWDRLVREAVREQVEIEVYLPLRGIVSRLLVNAWRHEDMAVSFKVQVC